MPTTTDILGRGIAFPLRLSARRGIAASEGERRIQESIQMILGTQPGERLMRPTFGCRLKGLVFAPNTIGTANLARFYVEDALITWEPRIELLKVVVSNRQDDEYGPILSVQVNYRIRATGAPQTLAFAIPLA